MINISVQNVKNWVWKQIFNKNNDHKLFIYYCTTVKPLNNGWKITSQCMQNKNYQKTINYLATSFQMDGAIIQGLGTHL